MAVCGYAPNVQDAALDESAARVREGGVNTGMYLFRPCRHCYMGTRKSGYVGRDISRDSLKALLFGGDSGEEKRRMLECCGDV